LQDIVGEQNKNPTSCSEFHREVNIESDALPTLTNFVEILHTYLKIYTNPDARALKAVQFKRNDTRYVITL